MSEHNIHTTEDHAHGDHAGLSKKKNMGSIRYPVGNYSN